MREDSLYFINATRLYNIMENALWKASSRAYQYAERNVWFGAGVTYQKLDLEANALMMRACLKLFEVTGNFTYYNRALELYHTFENDMFDSSNNAYITSFGTILNTDFNLTSNLILVESYLKAFDIYNSTVLGAAFNITGNDYIFNQDVINLTCDYKFKKTISYSQPISGFNTTIYNDITGGVITYIFRYPNETILM